MSIFQLPDRLTAANTAPKLVFLTSEITLRDQLLWTELELRTALQPHHLVVLRGVNLSPDAAVASFREQSAEFTPFDGVVIIGGYDTVPPKRHKSIPPELWTTLSTQPNLTNGNYDSDAYHVWTDDHYVMPAGALAPTLPISRIPCWGTAAGTSSMTCQEFVIKAMQAPLHISGTPASSVGVRGTDFVFSNHTYNTYVAQPTSKMWTSPVTPPDTGIVRSFSDLQATFLYLVLHGKETNGTYYAGTPTTFKPIQIGSLPPPGQAESPIADTIFSSSCWGALLARQSAYWMTSGPGRNVRIPEESIAVLCLSYGANAFVGFTGSHFAPGDSVLAHKPYFAEPLHHLFWEYRIGNGLAPAKALFEARIEYQARAPYPTPYDVDPATLDDSQPWKPVNASAWDPKDDPYARAIEIKTFWSVACLGLGW